MLNLLNLGSTNTINPMKNTNPTLAIVLILTAISSQLIAQTAATKTSEAGAALVVAMSLTETAPMHFGTSSLVNNTGGTIILPSNSTVLNYSGGVAVSSATPAASNATYHVTGTALESYAVTLPASVTLTHLGTGTGVNTMEITELTARFSGTNADAVTSTISAAGADSFTLGGTLQVGANQVAGVYAGTFNVSIDYN